MILAIRCVDGLLRLAEYPMIDSSAAGVSSEMPIFVKIEEGIVDKPIFDQYVPAHRAYVQDLIAKGHCAKSGYWAERGGGMLIFEAASMDQAKAIIEQDPLVKNKCVKYELHEWRVLVE